MLTPQEVSERAFQRASFGGYNMAQVDEFLDVLTGDYTSLFNENAVLKSKMKVLVDRVEEYRSTEEAMRKALLTAQRMADDLVKDAERKKEELLRQTEHEVQSRRAELARELEAEEYRLQQARQSTASYVEKVCAMQREQSQLLEQLSKLAPATAPAQASTVEETVSEIDDNVQRLLAQAMNEAAAEVEAEKRAAQESAVDLSDTAEFTLPSQSDGREPEKSAALSLDTDQLQFGRNYEIK